MKIKRAIIPVAGKGTRFLPASKQIPKEMIPILNYPMIHYVVEEAVASGIEQVVFVLSPEKKVIEDYFNRNLALEDFLIKNGKEKDCKTIRDIASMVEVITVMQQEQLGLGHAILCAEEIMGEDNFAILLGDEIILSSTKTATKQLVDISANYAYAPVIGVREVSREETHNYGIVDGTNEVDGKTLLMKGMVERPSPEDAPSNLASPGRYIFNPEIFKYLKKIKKGAGGEYQLTDAIDLMAKKNRVYAHLIEGDRYDIGNVFGHLNAIVNFSLQREGTREYMRTILKKKIKNL